MSGGQRIYYAAPFHQAVLIAPGDHFLKEGHLIVRQGNNIMMIPDFEAYLKSKKIDCAAFRKAEPELWMTWKKEFEQMHPNSFTVQKLNLINPIRRKYQLPNVTVTVAPETTTPSTNTPVTPAAARPGKPVMKPKPKME